MYDVTTAPSITTLTKSRKTWAMMSQLTTMHEVQPGKTWALKSAASSANQGKINRGETKTGDEV